MLIFVFLSLVSCHLGFLTIVSVLHILLLQLALSTEREKSCTGRGTGLKKIAEHTRHRCIFEDAGDEQRGNEDQRKERGERMKRC